MEIRTLYKYQREDGGVSVSPVKPETECVETYRIIADEGKLVTNDNANFHSVIDSDIKEGWTEVVEATDEDYAEAGKILLGVSE